MRKLGLIGLVAVAACADHPYDTSGPAIDPNAPRVHITSPARGTIAGDVHVVMVSGNATDDNAVVSVTVNDVPAALAADGSFTAMVPVQPGTNLLHAIAKDAQGNMGKESRAVVAGPMTALADAVPSAITATLSAQTFAALGRGAAGFINSPSAAMLLVNPATPVVDVGGGPDCLYGQGFITSFSVTGADVTLAPQTGGLWLDAELDNVQVGMHLQYAAACLDGSRDITIGASHISVSGIMTIGLVGHDFDIHFDNPTVQITGFNADLGGIPGAVVDLLHLDTAMGPVLGWATQKFVVPMLNSALAGLNNTKTIDVLGTMVDIDVKPAKLEFTTAGGIVELDTTMRAHGDSGKFVYVPNVVPAMDLSHGFQLAVADDAANQLLTSLWSAKGFDKTLKLKNGPYGDVGKLFDSVELQAAVPPYVDATNGRLELTIGDLMATFRDGSNVATNIAISAQVDVKVTAGSQGVMRLEVGTPTTYVDILDSADGVEGSNQLSNADFEAITSFALGRVIAVGSGSIGAIPLPSVGGVAVTDLSVAEQTGYLVVAGEVQ